MAGGVGFAHESNPFDISGGGVGGCGDGGKKTTAEAKAAIEEEFGENPYRFLVRGRESPFFWAFPRINFEPLRIAGRQINCSPSEIA